MNNYELIIEETNNDIAKIGESIDHINEIIKGYSKTIYNRMLEELRYNIGPAVRIDEIEIQNIINEDMSKLKRSLIKKFDEILVIIKSNDENCVDRLEGMIEQLNQTLAEFKNYSVLFEGIKEEIVSNIKSETHRKNYSNDNFNQSYYAIIQIIRKICDKNFKNLIEDIIVTLEPYVEEIKNDSSKLRKEISIQNIELEEISLEDNDISKKQKNIDPIDDLIIKSNDPIVIENQKKITSMTNLNKLPLKEVDGKIVLEFISDEGKMIIYDEEAIAFEMKLNNQYEKEYGTAIDEATNSLPNNFLL